MVLLSAVSSQKIVCFKGNNAIIDANALESKVFRYVGSNQYCAGGPPSMGVL